MDRMIWGIGSGVVAALCAVVVSCGSGDADGADTSGGDAFDAVDAGRDIAPDAPDDLGGADAPDDTGPPDEAIVVMTYNVMCSFCVYDDQADWISAWDERLPWLRDVVARHDPDLMGIQELNSLDDAHPDQVDAIGDPAVYGSVYYVGGPAGGIYESYPDATIHYRKSRFELKDHGFFWLGPTPDEPYSHGFAPGASFPRVMAWTLLHDRVTDRDLYFATTHFDNNVPNQEESAPLVLERFEDMAAQHPFILNGDFNADPSDPAYGILAEGVDGQGFHFDNAFDLAEGGMRVETNREPVPDYDASRRIDHVWLAGGTFAVTDWAVDLWGYGPHDQPPSDHDAMVTTLRLQ